MSKRVVKRPRPSPSQKRLDAILRYIEAERDNLGRAITLLGCLALALQHDEHLQTGLCYHDIARLAQQLVDKSMDALDSGNLPGESP